jgi:5-methylcytosine-specific restriction enzyme A
MPTLKKATKQKTKSNKKEERQKIYNNTRWRKLRDAKLQQCPLCEICLAKGIITPAIDIHHIDSFMNYDGLKRLEKAYNFRNLLSICKECHQKIHNG